jgi:rare lipoprotein A
MKKELLRPLVILITVIVLSLTLTNCKATNKTHGCATYYHDKFHGRKTASGEIYDKKLFTAASNVYPLGTILRITNKANGRSIVVKVNDRGNLYNRTLDLSKEAFGYLSPFDVGVIDITIEELSFKPF